jgi:NAD(P)-dependent dehydrogenase (short-subunit alcohol dehydrogenase family)
VNNPLAVVTGGSRGIGAATAVELARNGFGVLFTYRNKASRANRVVSEITRAGGRVSALAADITTEDGRRQLVDRISMLGGALTCVVLNASGGLERDLLRTNPAYPMLINCDAQVALVELLLPHLAQPATVIFITSHWAHLFGRVMQLPEYEPIARSKHAGEVALRQLQGRLAARGVRLLIVSGDLVDGTITARLLERAAPGITAHRQQVAGVIVTRDDMAHAIVQAALEPMLPSGKTVVVGAPLASVLTRGE